MYLSSISPISRASSFINFYVLTNEGMSSDKGDRRGNLATESETEMTVITPPSDANPEEDVFGGLILKHVYLIAGLVARRHFWV
ncbi:MAG: hypothetical protein DLM72_10150 [Candidatus Nitrosopolaris wilkensis]|nr:MAG: hypothetical protein DLM72_10150 [Candidatus Nitrosopolaris wilkensis]